jgi:hypothetical protein
LITNIRAGGDNLASMHPIGKKRRGTYWAKVNSGIRKDDVQIIRSICNDVAKWVNSGYPKIDKLDSASVRALVPIVSRIQEKYLEVKEKGAKVTLEFHPIYKDDGSLAMEKMFEQNKVAMAMGWTLKNNVYVSAKCPECPKKYTTYATYKKHLASHGIDESKIDYESMNFDI